VSTRSSEWTDFLSEKPSRSGEMASPQRAPANSPRATVVVSPKRESATWARLLISYKRRRLAWARPAIGHAVFLRLVVMDCLINGSTRFKIWGLENAWKSVVMKLDWCVGVIFCMKLIGLLNNVMKGINLHEWEGVWVMNDELDKFLAYNEHEMVGYESGMVMRWAKILYSWMEYEELVWVWPGI